MLELSDNLTGKKAKFSTYLSVSENDKEYVFDFSAKDSTFYCPFSAYNEDHWKGDVCEVFIGSADDVRYYYEIEVSPKGGVFLAKIFNPNTTNDVCPKEVEVTFIENNLIKTSATISGKDYAVVIRIDKQALSIAKEKVVFNAFRIDTEGIMQDKNLFALSPTLCDRFHVTSSFVKLEDYLNR